MSFKLYYCRFNKLTDRFFKTNPWPDAEVVAPIIQNGKFGLQSSSNMSYFLSFFSKRDNFNDFLFVFLDIEPPQKGESFRKR